MTTPSTTPSGAAKTSTPARGANSRDTALMKF